MLGIEMDPEKCYDFCDADIRIYVEEGLAQESADKIHQHLWDCDYCNNRVEDEFYAKLRKEAAEWRDNPSGHPLIS